MRSRAVDLSLLALAVVWGSSYLTVKDVASSTPLIALLCLRFAISSLGMAAIGGRRLTTWRRDEFRHGLFYGALQAVVLWIEAWGVTKTSAANAGLIISLAIIGVPLYESWALRRRLPTSFTVCTVSAFLGVALLVVGHHGGGVHVGDFVFLAAAAGRTWYFGSLGKVLATTPIDVVRFNLVGCVTSTVLFFAIDPAVTLRTVGLVTAGAWGGLLYLSLISTVAGFVVQTWAIQRTSAARAALLMATEPLWSTVIAIGIGGERLGFLAIVGAVVLLVSTGVGERIETKARLTT